MKMYLCVFNVILIALTFVEHTNGMVDGLYCGVNNCYEVLEVTRDTPKAEISKAYRRLAKKHHPDKHQGKAKEEASEKFKIIATAYEVLRDEETRIDYDYMLDNPQEYYRHYYHYYRRKMSPKVDVRLVIAVSITVISVFQYYTAMFRWSSGLRHLSSQVKYRQMALQAAEEEGLLDALKKMKKRNKEEIKAEEERIILAVLESKMDIRGGYAKPKFRDVLWMQIILLPRTIYLYLAWHVRWIWKFQIKKEEYGLDEQQYLIRKHMGLSENQYESIPEEEKLEFLDRSLWKYECYQDWKLEKNEQIKRQMAESAKYKSYRRYMKKHGSGRMYFDDS